MRPILRPGLRLLRRDRHSWQLGLDWPGAAVLPDDPAAASLVAAMDGFHDREGLIRSVMARGHTRSACEAALGRLDRCGALSDADEQRPTAVEEPTWAAWSLLAGPRSTAQDVLDGRASLRTAVSGDGLVAAEVRRLLGLAAVTVVEGVSTAHLVIVANDREPPRDQSDELMHRSVPHLWVGLRDIVGVVGPLVVPGSSACLRCADAGRTERDPAWPTLLDASAAHPVDPPAADPVVCALVAAWAVHEVAVWASGLVPQTLNAVIELPYGFGTVARLGFEPHPACGCGWPVWQDTMGA